MEEAVKLELPLREAYQLEEGLRVFACVFSDGGYGFGNIRRILWDALPELPACPRCGNQKTVHFDWESDMYVCGACEHSFPYR